MTLRSGAGARLGRAAARVRVSDAGANDLRQGRPTAHPQAAGSKPDGSAAETRASTVLHNSKLPRGAAAAALAAAELETGRGRAGGPGRGFGGDEGFQVHEARLAIGG